MKYKNFLLILPVIFNLNATELKECKNEKDKEIGCVEIVDGDHAIIKKMETPYINGKENGLAKTYNYDGSYIETPYENGIKNGTSKAYFPNGKVEYEGIFKNDQKIKTTFYYIDGSIRVEVLYKNNKPISAKCGDGEKIPLSKITAKTPDLKNFCRKQDLENMKKNGGYDTEMGIDAYNKKDGSG